jgi:hypothetical protein
MPNGMPMNKRPVSPMNVTSSTTEPATTCCAAPNSIVYVPPLSVAEHSHYSVVVVVVVVAAVVVVVVVVVVVAPSSWTLLQEGATIDWCHLVHDRIAVRSETPSRSALALTACCVWQMASHCPWCRAPANQRKPQTTKQRHNDNNDADDAEVVKDVKNDKEGESITPKRETLWCLYSL